MTEAKLLVRRIPQALGNRVIMARKLRPALGFKVVNAPDPLKPIASLSDEVPLEEKTAASIDAVTQAFRESEKKLLATSYGKNETGYYRVMVFSTEEQADAFMKAVGQDPADIYFDGRRLADRLGIAIPDDVWNLYKRTNTPNKRLSALALPRKGPTDGQEARRAQENVAKSKPKKGKAKSKAAKKTSTSNE